MSSSLSQQKSNRTRLHTLLIQGVNNLDLMRKINLFTLQKLDQRRATSNINSYVKKHDVPNSFYGTVQKKASLQQKMNGVNQIVKSYKGNLSDDICQNFYNSESDQQKRRFVDNYLKNSSSKNEINHFYSIINEKERDFLDNAMKKVRNSWNSLSYTDSSFLRKSIRKVLHFHNDK